MIENSRKDYTFIFHEIVTFEPIIALFKFHFIFINDNKIIRARENGI
jgi:hypothetical protein